MKVGEHTKIWHPEHSNIQECIIGEHCTIHSHVWIGDRVKIGDYCKIQSFSFIPTGVRIGDKVFIGPRVTFTNDKYPPGTVDEWLPTIVSDNVSIGAGVCILAGVTLGKGCKIGMGSIVTKNVPDGETWCGNPAKKMDKRETHPFFQGHLD